MHRLKNKNTGVVSSYNDEQLADLKKHPELFKLFDVISEKTEPAPPEVAALKRNSKKNHNEQNPRTSPSSEAIKRNSKNSP